MDLSLLILSPRSQNLLVLYLVTANNQIFIFGYLSRIALHDILDEI